MKTLRAVVARCFRKVPTASSVQTVTRPLRVERSKHNVSRKAISRSALYVLYALKKAGYPAYLVGGGVRDLLLGLQPKDFDIVTDKRPEVLRQLFKRNSCIIGKRFRLLHVFFSKEVVELSTFRSMLHAEKSNQQNNIYGTIEEDVWRRDFTINALYYNIADFSIVDFVGGIQDLAKKQLRIIGEAETRYREDPVRLLRALRLAAKLDFEIEAKTVAPIPALGYTLLTVPPARLLDEFSKLFLKGHAVSSFFMLERFDYFSILFPGLSRYASDQHNIALRDFMENAMQSTDKRIAQGLSVSPAFLFAAIYWVPLCLELQNSSQPEGGEEFNKVAFSLLVEQAKVIAIPRKMMEMVVAIWSLQKRLTVIRRRKTSALLRHAYFSAALDFLDLRVKMGAPYKKNLQFWQQKTGKSRC